MVPYQATTAWQHTVQYPSPLPPPADRPRLEMGESGHILQRCCRNAMSICFPLKYAMDSILYAPTRYNPRHSSMASGRSHQRCERGLLCSDTFGFIVFSICLANQVVVLWDHGLYGNYRFNYRGAYDVRVIARVDHHSLKMEPVAVGDTVGRKQEKWRWGDQDGGLISGSTFTGTIIELYASPVIAMFSTVS